jgi:dihydroxyacetone kinase-like predicted kinase
MAGPCEVGDALGIVSGEFSVVGNDLAEAARDVVSRLLAPGSELVTLVRGVDGTTELTDAVETFVRDQRVDLDVVVYDGDQENYPLFIAVE